MAGSVAPDVAPVQRPARDTLRPLHATAANPARTRVARRLLSWPPMTRTISWIAIAWVSACVNAEPFRCDSTSACVVGDVQGTCEPSGMCSFPDGTCGSGRRYGDYAADL